MNAYELKYNVEKTGSCFFSRSSMRFFGDTMKNYGVRPATITTSYDEQGNYVDNGATVKAWELYRRHPVKFGLQDSVYFDQATFERIHPKR